MRQISEAIRRDVIDELRLRKVTWCGRLTEIEFISRLWDIKKLPSWDDRYKDFEGDWYQHRVMNYDWEEDWLYTDPRLNLMRCEDETFLNVLRTMIHPLVRSDESEREILLKVFNDNLRFAGYKFVEKRRRNEKPEYGAVRVDGVSIEVENEAVISRHEFALQQLKKCEEKLEKEDYDGAITSSRSLIEAVLGDIHEQCTGLKLEESGDLTNDYKKIKGLLNLSESNQAHEALKSITRSFSTIIQGIDTLSNKIGDRHRPVAKPARHHAKLVVNSAKTIVDFLYDTLEYQRGRRDGILSELFPALSTWQERRRFLSLEKIHSDLELQRILAPCDRFLRDLIKDHLIETHEVSNFFSNDIFFACMRLFFDDLTQQDIGRIFKKCHGNRQAVGLPHFLQEVAQRRSELLGGYPDVREYIKGIPKEQEIDL